jgi:hypothetical protein
MSVSLDYLQRCGAETGFQPATLEKVVRLGDLAGDIARQPLLGQALATGVHDLAAPSMRRPTS